MAKPKILIHLSPDAHPSTFDSVVAIDAGVDHILNHGNVTPEQIEDLVHGAMFTRSTDDLRSTALFFGGHDIEATQSLVDRAKAAFFGPMRVSMMADPNGCNTTAAATVLRVQQHASLSGKTVTIAGGTGAVGTRIAQLIGKITSPGPASTEKPTRINIGSRDIEKAQAVCTRLKNTLPKADFSPYRHDRSDCSDSTVYNADVLISAGAAGVQLVKNNWQTHPKRQLVIDLNAVPPVGIEGIDPTNDAEILGNTTCYGAIGIGNLKMKIHKHAIKNLFNSNDQTLEVEEIFAIAEDM